MTIIHNELLAKVLGGTAGVAQGPTPNCGDKKSWPNSPGIMPIIGGGAASHPIIPCRDTPTGPTPTLPRLPTPSPLPPNETT
jgi:hypothetical protein